MATVIDWNVISPLVQLAARPIGQSALRYEVREVTDEVRIYFASGWYADVAWEMVHGLDTDDHETISRLSDELTKQYERRGMPIAMYPRSTRGGAAETEKRVNECMARFKDEIDDRIIGSLHKKQLEFLATPMKKRPGYRMSKSTWNLKHVMTSESDSARLLRILESRGREDNICATAHAQCMTPAEEPAASAAWSARLRELQSEAREKERHQVLVDNSWWDD